MSKTDKVEHESVKNDQPSEQIEKFPSITNGYNRNGLFHRIVKNQTTEKICIDLDKAKLAEYMVENS